MSILRINSAINPLQVNGVYVTDQFHIASTQPAHGVVKDIVYPRTVGRKYMQLGSAHSDDTSQAIVFSPGQSGHDNVIYADTWADWQQLIKDIQASLQDTPIGLLEFLGLQEENMRFEFTLTGGPRQTALRGVTVVMQEFSLSCSKYHGRYVN